MNDKLGKGVGALFSQMDKDKEKASNNGKALEVDINLIDVNKFQPRTDFNEDKIKELANSIKEHGIIQPLVVSKEGDRYKLIAGERRLRASKLLKKETVPVTLRDSDDEDKSLIAIIENIQRKDLNPVELAKAYSLTIKKFKITQEQLSSKLGIPRTAIANYCRILKLPDEVLEKVETSEITFGHAKVLAGLKDDDLIIALGEKIINEGLSVSRLTRLVNTPEDIKKVSSATESKYNLSPQIKKAQDDFNMKLGLNSKIKSKKNGAGQINIPYDNEKDLKRILDKLLKQFE